MTICGALALASALAGVAGSAAWAAGTDSSPVPSPDNAAYVKATAHDPRYEDRTLWPAWVEKTDFIKENWPEARVLVYAHPGETVRGVDLSDAANWRRPEGTRAKRAPDERTDVVFPATEKPYYVSTRKRGHALRVRHVTVQPGARVCLFQAEINGNLWVKDGGAYSRKHGRLSPMEKSTFCRSDNEELQFIPNMQVHRKRKGASTEWIGKWKQGDDVNIFSGRFIVAPGSTFLPTDRRPQRIGPDAQLVLLSGATFHLRGNCYHDVDLMVGGKILAGTAQRPLTEDCTLGLSFKAQGVGDIRGSRPGDVGMVLFAEGGIAVHSASPRKARLVIKWHRREVETRRAGLKNGVPPEVAKMPHGISMVLAGNARLDGVEFQDVLPGGILLAEPQARKAWKNVAFKNCFADGDALFGRYTGQTNLIRNGHTRWRRPDPDAMIRPPGAGAPADDADRNPAAGEGQGPRHSS